MAQRSSSINITYHNFSSRFPPSLTSLPPTNLTCPYPLHPELCNPKITLFLAKSFVW